MMHLDDDGERFDLPTFFQRILHLPTLVDPALIIINYNECPPTYTYEDSSTKPDGNGDNKGGINQDQHQPTSDHFVKDSMETSTSRDPLNTESGDTVGNSFSFVQKPLCGKVNEGKFETFKDEEDAESIIVYGPSLGQASGTSIEDSLFGSDLITENIGYQYESIDSYHRSSFSEATVKVKSRIFQDYSLELKSEACSIEDAFLNGRDLITENTGCNSESIDSFYQRPFSKGFREGKSRITDDSLLGPKTEASVGETLFGNDRNAENPEEVLKAIPVEKFVTDKNPSFGLKSEDSVEETLLGNYRTTEYPEKVQNGVKEDKSRIDNDPSFGLKTNVSVEEKLLDCDQNTENPEKIRKAIPDGSLFKEDANNHPSLAEKEECTNYYPTLYTTMMRIMRNVGRQDEDQILRCEVEGFTCNFCGDNFQSRDELRDHKRGYVDFVPSRAHIHSRYSQRYCIVLGYSRSRHLQFKCSHCQKRFKRFGDYARHCNNQQICKRHRSYLFSPFVQYCQLDNEEMGFECLLCQESSTVYAELKFHECVISRDLPEKDPPADEDSDNDENDSEDKSIKCDLCEIEFHGTQNYTDHRREHARGEKYECKECYQTFKRLCSFKTHMAESHKVKSRERTDRSAKCKV